MDTNRIIGLIILAVFSAVLAFAVKKIVELKNELPTLKTMLPTEIQRVLEEAAKFGSEFVEQMDKNGALTEYLKGLKSKSEVKLDLAVDYAVQYIEGLFAKNGFDIDIDQEALKALIQKYVWDNPDLFPSNGEATPEQDK